MNPKKIGQFLVFLLIQILFIPLAIFGFILCLYKELAISKKLGVSMTAGQAIQPKWFLHHFGVRADKKTIRFMRYLPNESVFGLWLIFLPMFIANKLTGFSLALVKIPDQGKETFATFINMRITQFDHIVEKYINEVDQIVMMGGGFDLRFIRYTKGKNLKVFDIDQEKTQQLKLDVMKKAGIESDWITYIPVDFREESWVDKLTENGFDKTLKTYFHWETVAIYLDEEVVKDTMSKMSEISPKGSIIAQDFYSKEWLEKQISKSGKLAEFTGEPLNSSTGMPIDAESYIRSFYTEYGYELKDCILAGHKSKSGKPFYAVTTAERK
ncbi:MAG: class I SAM-dependent methyltransferase [Promethearchaeota archaeon]